MLKRDNAVKINGFDTLREDRNRNGGGVAMYIRNSINYVVGNDLINC